MRFNNLLGVTVSSYLTAQVLAQQSSKSTGFKGCDALLDAGLGNITVFPLDNAYNESVSTYPSSESRRLRPSCIVQPRSTEDVSKTVKALGGASGAGSWDIAIRSGGHGYFGSNGVTRGVTIDLTFFNSTELVEDSSGNWTRHWNGTSTLTKSVARIRPAARWGSIITYLEQYNLSVTGGRSGHVGAGGLLLSGGASYHIQQWGFSCDNVINYEVVLANGSIVEANTRENTDLFKALKGGGNNLGIVTRFDMRTFTIPPDGVYGGILIPSWNDVDILNKQFLDYATSIGGGSPDHEFIVWRNNDAQPNIMVMAVSTDGNEHSESFTPFDAIPLEMDFRARQNLSQVAESISDTGGSHDMGFTLTLQATTEVMDKCAEVFLDLTEDLQQSDIPLLVTFVFQPFPKNLASASPGGNILGLHKTLPADSILFDVGGTLNASEIAYDGIAYSMIAKAVEEIRAFSASREGHSSYIYMNYANPEQDVIGSYGADNVRFLKDTAAKYDPTAFFQDRVPGGFKMSRL
ncbi:Bifunctional solanapyrone synthase 6 [Colletotrichum chlorophyti]|uniref:Bifunctional solanapyrone synthase 6 n=1 Tax=Colletotrichum chlorophyti TaxID=708187 RepID=A0A1Q8RL61_9PEZI|nr:Bifunctional solanapyrone synthase 6 [Colletotrichum chlorophyti]